MLSSAGKSPLASGACISMEMMRLPSIKLGIAALTGRARLLEFIHRRVLNTCGTYLNCRPPFNGQGPRWSPSLRSIQHGGDARLQDLDVGSRTTSYV